MRISDWSSDVCSSDLAGRQARHAASEQAARADFFQRGARNVDHLLCVVLVRPQPARGEEARNDAVEHLERRLGVEIELFGGGHDAERSEEHTSELQSLMRISYAAFCLTKKNKKNKAYIMTPHQD